MRINDMKTISLALTIFMLVGAAEVRADDMLLGVAAKKNTFVGIGDIVSGATAYYGGRAYSAAVAATGTQKAFNLRRVSDAVKCDILIASSGDLGLTTATCNSSTQGGITPSVFAGTDATGTGSISGTTLTFTGGHQYDTVTGGTVLAGTYIISGSSPTWTVNQSQTVASATLTLTWGLFITKAYDQSGNGNDVLNATDTSGAQPLFLASALGGHPAMVWNNSALLTSASPVSSISHPLTQGGVSKRTGNFGGFSQVFGAGSGGGNPRYGAGNTTNNIGFFAGAGEETVTAADNTWHATVANYNGASSFLYVDGVQSTNRNPGSTAYSSTIALSSDGGGGAWTGPVAETFMYPSAVSVGNNALLNSNMHAYWGF